MVASNCPERHRELVAAAATFKAALRTIATAIADQHQGTGGAEVDSKVCDAAGRAVSAAEELKALLCGAAAGDVFQWLPLASSRRLVELGLPDALASVLDACAGQGAAAKAALWSAVQGAAECIALLGSVAGRASARSPEPLEVLLQIACGPLPAACARYLQRATAATIACDSPDGAGPCVEAAVRAADALAAPFGALVAAATVGAKAAELRGPLVDSCCGAGLLAAVCGALMTASRCREWGGTEAQGRVARSCERASATLLSLAVYLASPHPNASQDDSTEPESPVSGPLASSPFTSLLASTGSLGGASGSDSPLASSASNTPKQLLMLPRSAGLSEGAPAESLATLAAPEVQAFLQERVRHALHEAKAGTSDDTGGSLDLLPGRVASGGSGPLAVAHSVLLCWRAVLLSPGEGRRTLVDPASGASALMASVLKICVGQAGSRSSWGAAVEPAAARCVVLASHCLQAVVEAPAGCSTTAGPGAAIALLPPATAAAAWAANAAAGAWDSAKAKLPGHELPYSRQIKCADRATAESLESCGTAATAALTLTRALLAAASAPTPGLFREPSPAAPKPAWVTVAAGGMLPALEALLRRVPPTAPAHIVAAGLLADLLPPIAAPPPTAPGSDTQDAASALVTLRKFMARAATCGAGAAEAKATGDVAAAGLRLLSALLDDAIRASVHGGDCCGDSATAAAGDLMAFGVAQLAPGLQALIASLPRAAQSTALSATLISVLARAATVPKLGLTPILLAHGTAAFAASALARAPASTYPGACAQLVAQALDLADALMPATAATGPACCGTIGCGVKAPALAALLQSRLLAEIDAVMARMASEQVDADGRALMRTISAPPLQLGGSLGAPLRRMGTDVAAPTPFAVCGSAPAHAPCFGTCRGNSFGSFASMGGCSATTGGVDPIGVGLWSDTAALQDLRGRLDGIALRTGAAVLALCVPAVKLTTDAVVPRAPSVRAGPEEALASLRAAVAAATTATRSASADDAGDGDHPAWPSGVVRGGSAPLPGFDHVDLPVLGWSAAGSSLGSGADGLLRSPNSVGAEGPPALLYSVGSADGTFGAAVDEVCMPMAVGLREPLPSKVSKRLLRALLVVTPAVTKTANAAGGSAVVDPQKLVRAVPALSELRVGCWSATCTSLAGASESTAPLKPCAGCGVARFCSRACSSAAYAAHLPDCRPAAPAACAHAAGGSGGPSNA